MFWYKSITRPSDYRAILYKGNTWSTGFCFLRDSSKESFYVLVNDQIYGRVYLAHPVFQLNIWYHLALVYSADDKITFYINGEKYSSHDASIMKWDTVALVMGKDNSIIDEVRIYNRALSEWEIKLHYFIDTIWKRTIRYSIRKIAKLVARTIPYRDEYLVYSTGTSGISFTIDFYCSSKSELDSLIYGYRNRLPVVYIDEHGRHYKCMITDLSIEEISVNYYRGTLKLQEVHQ